ncbi:ribbon-helix-helix domain-containing protein [Alkalibacillus haloalkaliphilus]|uniref:ribbon-helix-helix domain-containing protein n=1 Tax=Alkalibacillus haloalkaliphilus TaxID=94136 RepID=UPI0029366115|nr:hypothetical protein [Alkalibacillus haloalkaliphilus]MDV2581672.1 hypothetical protein [Alkalibacillus haloalkaliphilus]
MSNRITISFLPERDKDIIEYIKSKKYDNVSEYIRSLIRNDMEEIPKNNRNDAELIEQILEKIKGSSENPAKDANIIEDSIQKGEVKDAIIDLF